MPIERIFRKELRGSSRITGLAIGLYRKKLPQV
jgi:hypothetical protein